MSRASDSLAITSDASAVLLSSFCVMHCLLIPALSAMAPLTTVWVGQEWVHQALVVAALLVSGYAIRVSLADSEGRWFASLAAIGLTILTGAAFVPFFHDYETPMTVVGAVMLAASHVYRWIWRHQHKRQVK